MLTLARILPIAVVLAAADSSPPPAAVPLPAAPQQTAPNLVPTTDDEIRATLVGKAACPPEPWPVGTGPWEFREGGEYFRAQDLASAHGRYTVQDGKICVMLAGSDKADFCLALLKRGETYLFRLDESPTSASRREPVAITPCPLPLEIAR